VARVPISIGGEKVSSCEALKLPAGGEACRQGNKSGLKVRDIPKKRKKRDRRLSPILRDGEEKTTNASLENTGY